MNTSAKAPLGFFLFSGTMKVGYRLTGEHSWSDLHDVGRFSIIALSWPDALEQLAAATGTSCAKYFFELKDVEGF